MCHKHQFPCLHCHPHDYIRMVQHMIESCLVFQMSKDECVEALAKHANIEPVITLTVQQRVSTQNMTAFRRRKHWQRFK
ncbi:hypothetical protein V6Z12_A09G034500 [Gossypium hirsutum]